MAILGGSGNDTIRVPSGTSTIDGRGGTNTAVLPNYYEWYRITRAADGGWDVVDIHGGGLSTHLLNIHVLQFANNVFVGLSPTVTVNGTTGTDTFIITDTVRSIAGNTGTDSAVFQKVQTNYQITKAADGGVDVKDLATSTIVHLTGVETLKFAGGTSFATANATAPSTTTTSPTTTPTTTPTAGTATVTGTSGDDVLTVGTATTMVDGAAGMDVAKFQSSRGAYTVTNLTGGAFDVKNTASGVTTRLKGIEVLSFSDGQTIGKQTGTTSNDTITVADTTRWIDGGAGSDTAVFKYDMSWYKITASSRGGVDVLEEHATGTPVHVDNVEVLKFANNGTYNVGGGSTTTSPTTTTPTTTTPPPTTTSPTTGTATVTGTTGDDVLTVGTATTTVDGAAGIDVAKFQSSLGAYTVTNLTGGAFDVKNTSSGVTTRLRGIEVLSFTDGQTIGKQTGTTGNDTITVADTTRWIDGGTGTDTAVFKNDMSWYKITASSRGGVDVLEEHATGTPVHVDNVEVLKFANNVTYSVPTGSTTTSPTSPTTETPTTTTPTTTTPPPTTTTPTAPTTTTPTTSGSAPTPLPTGTSAKAPDLPDATSSTEVVSFRLANNTTQTEVGRVISFGQAFKQGDIPAGTQLTAKINGVDVPVQVDVKTTNADGSARFAIISVKAPDLAAGSSVDVMLSKGAPVSGTVITPESIVGRGYDTKLTLTFHQADGTLKAQTIDAGAELSKALAAGTANVWTKGPLATEVRVDVKLNDQMHATFDIRANADGSFKTDVQVYNDAAYKAATTYLYDVEIRDHSKVAFTQSNVSHYQYSSWHKEVWSGAAPGQHVIHDMTYLVKSGAISAFDPSLGVNTSALTADLDRLSKSDTSLLGNALVLKYMPQTGGRSDIGLTTEWSANYLASMSEAAKKVMLANADAAGAVPWHVRDDTINKMATIDNRPGLWLDERNNTADKLTTNYAEAVKASGWTPDFAHVPDLSYVPYLITGTRYYLDQLQAQANADLLYYDSGYRGGSQGLINGQVRNMAWTIRDLGNAAYLSADGDPLKAYFANKLDNNLTKYVNDYVVNGKGDAQGATEGYFLDSYHPDTTAPWQQDYMAMTMANLARQGFVKAGTMAEWQENFVSGRFLHGEDGFNPLNGPAYYLTFLNSSTGKVASTWKELYDLSFAGTTAPTKMAGYPDWGAGYAANAKGATAALYAVTKDPDSLDAYTVIAQNTPLMQKSYMDEQTWDVTPVLKDGYHLLNSEIFVLAAGSNVQAQTAHSMLVATSGTNVLRGNSGIDVLKAGSGNDQLFGNAGDDLLFAGTGTSRLDGGTGNNFLKGGSGADTFVFQADTAAKDIVDNFRAGVDTMEIKVGTTGLTAQQLVQTATSDAAGKAVLHLSAQHEVTMQDVTVSQLDVRWFHMV